MLATPLFSEEDADLRDVKWHSHNNRHAMCGSGNNKQYAHRIVLERKIGRKLKAGELTDHINRVMLDNRRENLRVADKSLNSINRDIRSDNTTGYVGVYLHWPKIYQEKGWGKRWYYRIDRKGAKTFYSSYYKTPLEAHLARQQVVNHP